MMANLISNYKGLELDLEKITTLYKDGDYEVFWLGIDNETTFRCNVYLIKSGDEAVIIDPGSREFFEEVKKRALQVVDSIECIKGIIVCHQDPDVAASIIDWLELKNDIIIISSDRTNVLLPHYGKSIYEYHSINIDKNFVFSNGKELEFVEAPFLHFAGAFATYDRDSKFLFSGDIWAALDIKWNLVVSDFAEHKKNMDLFHIDYMASNIAARGFLTRLVGREIEAILPQHGSIIDKDNVENALDYLENLQCGTDIIYADLSLHDDFHLSQD